MLDDIDYKATGKDNATLTSGAKSGTVIDGLAKGAEVTITPDETKIPEGKKIDQYEIKTAVVVHSSADSNFTVEKMNITGDSFTVGEGVEMSEDAVKDMIKAIGKWGYDAYVKKLEVYVTPIYADAAAQIKGDINNNGSIDSADILRVKAHIKGVTLLTGDDFKCADMDDNNLITTSDLLKMKSIMKGIA
jgi:trehalose/maltose hydrolase-like predicted phosphorylase